jgi:hypothetical protein
VNEFGGLGYANFLSSHPKGRLMLIRGGEIHLIIFGSSTVLKVLVGYITDIKHLFVVVVGN